MIPYPYRSILTERDAGPRLFGAASPAEDFLQLVYGIDLLFDRAPLVLNREGRKVLLLYRDVAFLWRDVTDPFGELIANLSARWPLRLFGTAESRETVELTVRWEEGARVSALRSVSGRGVESLSGLCILLETDTPEEAGHLSDLCAHISPAEQSISVSRRHEGFLAGSGLIRPTLGSVYLYLVWKKTGAEALLDTLDFHQMEHLWRVFLSDGVQPAEFQWLWDSYNEGDAAHLLEWEMALQLVLEDLKFSIQRRDTYFQVEDGAGAVRRFNFSKGGPAERMFLKILFPMDTR